MKDRGTFQKTPLRDNTDKFCKKTKYKKKKTSKINITHTSLVAQHAVTLTCLQETKGHTRKFYMWVKGRTTNLITKTLAHHSSFQFALTPLRAGSPHTTPSLQFRCMQVYLNRCQESTTHALAASQMLDWQLWQHKSDVLTEFVVLNMNR